MHNLQEKERFSIVQDANVSYPRSPPFDPPKNYLELQRINRLSNNDPKNNVYDLVRRSLTNLGLDKNYIGTPDWNPFIDIVKPGQKVVIKPNFVVDGENLDLGMFYASVTHGSIIRPLIDYIYIATEGKSKIVIAEGPLEGTSFEDVSLRTGLLEMVKTLNKRYDNCIQLLDIRDYWIRPVIKIKIGDYTLKIGLKSKLQNSDNQYFTIDLSTYSEFEDIVEDVKNFVSTRSFERNVPSFAHSKGSHNYTISKIFLDADVIFNVPKLKTHKFAGITLCLKNYVGTTINRHYFAHYRKTDSNYRLQHVLFSSLMNTEINKKVAFGFSKKHRCSEISKPVACLGYGTRNDTIWRAILDIVRIVFYADKSGNLKQEKQRKHFAVVDGIISGEGDGPLRPSPKKLGLVLCGYDPVLIDILGAKIIGLDPLKIKTLCKALDSQKYPICDLSMKEIKHYLTLEIPSFDFVPAFQWEEAVARER